MGFVHDLRDEDDVPLYGECNRIERRIRLDDSLKRRPRQLARTFLHELLHANWPMTGRTALTDEDEERLVKRFEPIADILCMSVRERRRA